MKKRAMTRPLAILLLLARLQAPCAQESRKSPRELPQTQRNGSETSFQTGNSEQLEEIYAVIDDMRDQWISDIAANEEKISALKKRRNFWIKVSVCEAAIMALGAYCIHSFNK